MGIMVKRKRVEEGVDSVEELTHDVGYELESVDTSSVAEGPNNCPSGVATSTAHTSSSVTPEAIEAGTQEGEVQSLFWALLARAGYDVW